MDKTTLLRENMYDLGDKQKLDIKRAMIARAPKSAMRVIGFLIFFLTGISLINSNFPQDHADYESIYITFAVIVIGGVSHYSYQMLLFASNKKIRKFLEDNRSKDTRLFNIDSRMVFNAIFISLTFVWISDYYYSSLGVSVLLGVVSLVSPALTVELFREFEEKDEVYLEIALKELEKEVSKEKKTSSRDITRNELETIDYVIREMNMRNFEKWQASPLTQLAKLIKNTDDITLLSFQVNQCLPSLVEMVESPFKFDSEDRDDFKAYLKLIDKANNETLELIRRDDKELRKAHLAKLEKDLEG